VTLTAASPVNTGSYRLVRLGDAASNGLKIRCVFFSETYNAFVVLWQEQIESYGDGMAANVKRCEIV
jgi:hypothetical protein